MRSQVDSKWEPFPRRISVAQCKEPVRSIIHLMNTPQSGIFALGTISHAYVEFDLRSGTDGRVLAIAMANLREPRTTTGGVNLVLGFRPELWRELRPDDL